ncbi:hypothetical protein GALMADRAFT_136673 [Galerina marginata CBS 339.88]|uniref:Uncharacterized protein n=1 Tax=Galerina marginata (strain CBS 339.88) TaxID=685588 RepID=A0A067TME3_GALM3|nr:hypothetical protein GALMADRAFT_136673 [Galerina marginata CBS 339.88]
MGPCSGFPSDPVIPPYAAGALSTWLSPNIGVLSIPYNCKRFGLQATYLLTDSRYWLQAEDKTNKNWTLIKCGSPEAPEDWIEWLKGVPNGSGIGVDARMISHYSATVINSKISSKDSKLFFPPQNLVDLVWADKPSKSLAKIFVRHMEAADKDTIRKLERLRAWIRQQRASTVSYSRQEPTAAQMGIATLVTYSSFIAHVLNITGSDIPQDHLFHAYYAE